MLSLRFRLKNMSRHIFQLESDFQDPTEAAPKALPSFSGSEKLARYGSAARSSVEHLTLLVGKESAALSLIRHFGSLKALSRASFFKLFSVSYRCLRFGEVVLSKVMLHSPCWNHD